MSEEIACARKLLTIGAYRGAANVLFHAAVQRGSTDRKALSAWTPGGKVPLQPRPANDVALSSMPPVSPERA